MNEEYMHQARAVVWQDTLKDDELVAVKRLGDMDPSMAVAYVYVEFKRELEELKEEHRKALRPMAVATHAVAGLGGGAAIIIAYLGHMLGWDKVIK